MEHKVLFLFVLAGSLFAQETAVLHRGEVGSRSDSRSPLLALEAGQTITCRPLGAGASAAPAIDTFVYDEKKRLAGKDNEDSDPGAFEWRVPRTGRYYVVVRNVSDHAGQFEVSVRQTRGGEKPEDTLAVVRVFYATNRAVASSRPVRYAKEASPSGTIQVGYSDVSIPREHRLGELEGPSVFSLLLGSAADASKHVVIQSVEREDLDSFFHRIAVRSAGSKGKEAFVFIHGFAVSFDDALRRTAQLSYDLTFDGPAISFSWPTQESRTLPAYNRDGRNSEISADALKMFLEQLAARGKLERIHLIAHSMGNRVLARALQQMAATPAAGVRLQEVVMMAPDIDAALFRQLAAQMKSVTQRLTLYASSRDGALMLSKVYAGYPRAGQGGQDVVVVNGVETIDASAVDTSLVGLLHSYFADNSTVLSDLYQLMRGAATPRFRLLQAKHRDGVYWQFQPAAR